LADAPYYLEKGYLMPLGNGHFFLPLTLIFLIFNPALVPNAVLVSMQKAATADVVWDMKLAPNTWAKSTLTVKNQCKQQHSFTITLENVPYLRFLAELTVIVPGHSSRDLPVTFDSAGLKPGEYKGTILVKCNTCRKESTCHQDRETIPVRLTVTQVVATPTPTPPVESKSSLPSLSQYAGVRYNSAYGMLEFRDEDTFNATLKTMQIQDETFAGDNGDTAALLALLNQKPPLPPDEIKTRLLAASPLSDTILIGILTRIPSLPSDIIHEIFVANTSFSDDVTNKLKTSALPKRVLSQILEADDNDTIIEDTVLDAFELLFNFRSLRKEIEEKEKLWLDRGIDPQRKDADEFFIQDVYLRTLLNPRLEIKIGSSVYKFLNEKTLVQITNADFKTLDQLRRNKYIPRFVPPSHEPVNGIPQSQSGGIIPSNMMVQTLTPHTPCDAKFSTTVIQAGEIGFTNLSTGTPTLSFFWDFGDGYTSYQKTPVHSFGNGKFSVKLQVTDGLGNTCAYSKETVVGMCSVEWTLTSVGGKVNFTSKTAVVTQPVTYQWNFGDGQTSTDPSPTITYASSGTRDICLTITDAKKCSYTECKLVTVTIEDPEEAECCDGNDRDKNHWTEYASDRKFKYSIWQTNTLWYHRWGAKTRNYRLVVKTTGRGKKKKTTRKWKQQKADEISAGVSGIIYQTKPEGDKCEFAIQTDLKEERKKKDHVNFDHPAGAKFWTKQHSIFSKHYVVYNRTEYSNATTLFLTTDCPRKRKK